MKRLFLTLAAALAIGGVAQAEPLPTGLVTLAATAKREVPNDQMVASLYYENEQADARALMSDMNRVAGAALAVGKKYPGVVVKSAGYNTYPVYDEKQTLRSWRARVSILVQGPLEGATPQVVTELQEMLAVSSLYTTISESRSDEVYEELAVEALQAFRKKAAIYAGELSAKKWQVHSVDVQRAEGVAPRPRMEISKRVMMASADAMPPMAVEGGSSTLQSTVSGAIQLLPLPTQTVVEAR